jgi:hypothetical protein
VSEESWEKKKKKISALVAKTRMRNFGHKKTMPNTPPAKKVVFYCYAFIRALAVRFEND